jgi:hypothetical protein
MAVFPVKDFFLDGFWQNTLAWSSLILFLGVPVVALITWLIRRIMGVRSGNHYLGYTFGGLWIIGLFSFILLAGLFARNFRNRAGVESQINLTQPAANKLYLTAANGSVHFFGDDDFFGFDIDDDAPFYGLGHDTLMLKTIRINVVKSKDSAYHMYTMRFSRSNTNARAKELAEKIEFPVKQTDSVVELPKGFAISRNEKFRNQQVLVVVEVPVGKKIEIDRRLDEYEWFNIQTNHRGFRVTSDANWDDSYNWESDVEYIMTRDGLERTNGATEKELKEGKFRFKIDDKEGVTIEGEGVLKDKDSGYRYQGPDKKAKQDTVIIKTKIRTTSNTEEEEDQEEDNDNNSTTVSSVTLGTDVSPLLILNNLLR